MKLSKLTDLVGKDKKVRFLLYREGELWYETDCGFAFPIPKDDMRGATFLREEKSVYYMRFIRKHLEFLQTAIDQEGINECP